jgi:hypothetical protein
VSAPVEPVTDVAPVVAATVTDVSAGHSAPATPFTMVTGDPAAMVCEGDVCFIPGAPTDPTHL